MSSEDAQPWRQTGRWLPVLTMHPVLANSFEVLDQLLLLLTAHPSPTAMSVADLLVARALALGAEIRRLYPSARCEWGHWANRPALRLIAQHIMANEGPTADTSFEWLRAMMETLNPNDNHGFREMLMAVYLRRRLVNEASALAGRYPDDTEAMALLEARAHWAKGRQAEAGMLMKQLFGRSPFAKVWRSVKAACGGSGCIRDFRLCAGSEVGLPVSARPLAGPGAAPGADVGIGRDWRLGTDARAQYGPVDLLCASP